MRRSSPAFRKHTLLPLDDGLYALQATIQSLTRSSLHRCLQRHGISRLTAHLHDFINACNYGRRLKTLRGLTPYGYICKCCTSESKRFNLNPHHQARTKQQPRAMSPFGILRAILSLRHRHGMPCP